MLENYDSHGLPMRSCADTRKPHAAHGWKHPTLGDVHCWGRNVLPPDAEARYCTPGCNCVHCKDIRAGLWPRTIMCAKQWELLTPEEQMQIGESVGD